MAATPCFLPRLEICVGPKFYATDRIQQLPSGARSSAGTEAAHSFSSQHGQEFLEFALSLSDETL